MEERNKTKIQKADVQSVRTYSHEVLIFLRVHVFQLMSLVVNDVIEGLVLEQDPILRRAGHLRVCRYQNVVILQGVFIHNFIAYLRPLVLVSRVRQDLRHRSTKTFVKYSSFRVEQLRRGILQRLSRCIF